MKLLFIITLCLCTLSPYAQTNKISVPGPEACGVYSFAKISVSACNYSTREEVFTHVFSDTTSLDGLNELPFPIVPIFRSAGIGWNSYSGNNYLSMCTLWNNNKQYKVEENGELSLPSVEETADQENEGDYDAVDDPFPLPYSISPAIYELELEADTATFTFRIPYGNSLYDFSLEGKLVVVMVKDNTLKQAL